MAKKELEIKKEAFYGVNSSPLNKLTTPIHTIRPSTASRSGACAPQRKTLLCNFNSAKSTINTNLSRKTDYQLSVLKNIADEMSPSYAKQSPLASSLKINLGSAKSITPVCALFTPQTSSVASSTDKQAIKSCVFAKSSPKKVIYIRAFFKYYFFFQ